MGHCFYDTGDRRHFPGNSNWEGVQPAEEGDLIGMLLDLDQGSMTIWKNDVKLGVMQAEGLSGPLCWLLRPWWKEMQPKSTVPKKFRETSRPLRPRQSEVKCFYKHGSFYPTRCHTQRVTLAAAQSTAPHILSMTVSLSWVASAVQNPVPRTPACFTCAYCNPIRPPTSLSEK